MKKVEVVAGVIYFENKILCVQRPANKLSYISKKYEFPGGKIEPGETKEYALQRELLEELNLTVEIRSYYMSVIHAYPDFELTMHAFICNVNSTKLDLREHIDQKWLENRDLENLDWAEADIPIVKKLVEDG
jgi:8-oxo-dGTP diphosphatase